MTASLGVPENLPTSSSGSGWLVEWIANGKIPGAAKAIARLIGGVADLGTAVISIGTVKAEQVQQGIKDDTAAKSLVSKAVSKAAAKHSAEDTALVDRAVSYWIGTRLQEQRNREAIAVKTIEHLEQDGMLNEEKEGPADDWLNIFGKYAEQASSEKLQDTWARVLAGEVRHPGAFSFRTLQLVSVLDQNLADIIQEIAERVSNDSVIYLAEDQPLENKELEDFCVLEEIGFLRFQNLQSGLIANELGLVFAVHGSKAVVAKYPPGQKTMFMSAILSPVGKELLSIVSAKTSFETMQFIARLLKSKGGTDVGTVNVDKNGLAHMNSFIAL